ncbi:hypothetical protein CRE_24299 [Caenorhabditis remanei]|uniref:Uncharacterized protein n=1 Tax=Caenorhabditis remanei TaxID=31234 RepID=E3NMN2_CAERE|nr:hypothetical protein CRE_24299 [Caenorhabditis remanei]
MLFIPYLFYFGLYDIYYKTDTTLDNLESSEAQKWLVKWILKNILIIAYFRPGLPPQLLVLNDNILLKYGSAGLALTTVWIPCVKSFPTLSAILVVLHVICFVIGPFNTLRRFLKGGYRQYTGAELLRYLNFFNVLGRGIIFHFFEAKPIENPDDSFYLHIANFLNLTFAPQTPIEFVRFESILSVFSLITAMFFPGSFPIA